MILQVVFPKARHTQDANGQWCVWGGRRPRAKRRGYGYARGGSTVASRTQVLNHCVLRYAFNQKRKRDVIMSFIMNPRQRISEEKPLTAQVCQILGTSWEQTLCLLGHRWTLQEEARNQGGSPRPGNLTLMKAMLHLCPASTKVNNSNACVWGTSCETGC